MKPQVLQSLRIKVLEKSRIQYEIRKAELDHRKLLRDSSDSSSMCGLAHRWSCQCKGICPLHRRDIYTLAVYRHLQGEIPQR